MSAFCSNPNCACALPHVKRVEVRGVEVRDGRRYENGVDVGAAQPDTNPMRNYQRKGGRR